MYSSGYSQVNKFSPEAKKKMQYRTNGKSCGYYMRIVFFFSSLIQSLIIVSLVLFLVYGNRQDTSMVDRVQDLEESFSQLSIENVDLKKQRKNLTNKLNETLTEKAHNDYDLWRLRKVSNMSIAMIEECERKQQQCKTDLFGCKVRCTSGIRSPPPPIFPGGGCNCRLLEDQKKVVETNFTQTVRSIKTEKEQISKEKDKQILEAITLRRTKSILEKEVEFYKQKSKDEFSQALGSVSTVSKTLLEKIASLFPQHYPFQITCLKQKEHLEQIHSNCTSLSREVEDKLQHYLNIIGAQVSNMHGENNHLKAENWRLSIDYRECSQNRSAIIEQNKQNNDKLQKKHDDEKERLLKDKMDLNGAKEVLESSIKYKTSQVDHLNEQIKQLNMSCLMKTGIGGFSGGLGTRTSSQSGWGGFGGGSSSSSSSSSSSLGQGNTGSGSSFSSGLGLNKPGSTGAGSSRFPQSGSSSISSNTGAGYSRPSSTGGTFSSYGLGSNKPAESERSLTNTRLSSESTGSNTNTGLSSIGSNKPTVSGKSSSSLGFEFSASSSGSTSKSGSTGSGLFWPWNPSSSSGQSKTESVPGKPSSGSSYGGFGSSAGGGRTSGVASDAGGVTKHIQELQRLINPSAPQEKQELSRLLG
ncbi:plasmalemma vesicle associated protein a [Kryptolebias marmoratus]|uniref:plasmalemma vesicle associated protein a n=1 Tax=Kryptolebias marmoratus TaxID=37003 RepID=UPI0007F86B1B|nr:plasmalemma vesicle associated protein a [Kryptolebias marmoratus]